MNIIKIKACHEYWWWSEYAGPLKLSTGGAILKNNLTLCDEIDSFNKTFTAAVFPHHLRFAILSRYNLDEIG